MASGAFGGGGTFGRGAGSGGARPPRRDDFSRGSFVVGRLWRIPIRVHATLPIGAILFTGSLSIVRLLSFVFVILVHEIGHALVVRRVGARVTSITLHGMGGECAWRGEVTAIRRAFIAWGGVLAQLVLLTVAAVALSLAGGVLPLEMRAHLWRSLVWGNAFMAAFNLIPVPPLDGAEAWRLVPLALRRSRARRSRQKHKAAHAYLDAVARADRAEDEVERKRNSGG